MQKIERLAQLDIPQLFQDLTGLKPVRRPDWPGAYQPDGPDLVLGVGKYTFVFEIKGAATAAAVSQALSTLKRVAQSTSTAAIPVVAVPFMGAVGRRLCQEAGVSWMDLSGNARIIAPGLRIIVEGRPNRFTSRGRPANPFAPRSSRVARVLLLRWPERFTQRELFRLTGLDEGFVSRIVARLERRDGLIDRDARGALTARDPNLLLDAWHEVYDFNQHVIHQGHISARSSETLLKRLADACRERRLQYAATGLAAAWLLAPFAGFRLVTLYLARGPDKELLDDLGFREEPRGANTWFVVPGDTGVFDGGSERNGIQCVSPVQVYLDLKAHPERAAEAATRIRDEYLSWSVNARHADDGG